jgi:5-methyltetrahydropteroyltriglutamate--homocysteine methyltransferase
MRHSADRILTTHAGSLARPDALRELLIAKDERRPFDAAALTASVQSAVAQVVRQQVSAGLDVINDGE